MEMYKIQFSPKAKRNINKLHPAIKARVLEAIDELKTDPTPSNSRKLAGMPARLPSQWRLRVGTFRILYTIEKQIVTITIITVAPRGQVYKGKTK
jgi:mRNA interferase RelE/StbE